MKIQRSLIGLAGILTVLAYVVQSVGALSGDAGSLLYDTQLMLTGGTYVRDFFETNPPMIFYLYVPVIYFVKLTTIDLASAFRLYVCLLIFFSSCCCIHLLTRIFSEQKDKINLVVFVIVLLFILLFLPGFEFGQREHFFMIFFFPYLFASVLRFDRHSISPVFAILIGILAGLGIGLKPYFLFPIVLVELYFIVNKRWFAWLRIESVTCMAVLILYLISIVVYHPLYIHPMLPMISDLYFISTHESWAVIFSRFSVIYCCVIWMLYFFVHRKSRSTLMTIVMLALTGMIAAFIVPRSAWFYHVLPALGLSCLLAWLYSSSIIQYQFQNSARTVFDRGVFIIAGMVIFIIPFFYAVVNTTKSVLEKIDPNQQTLRAYVQASPLPHKLFCFSANTTVDCFPIVYDTHAEFAGRFPFLLVVAWFNSDGTTSGGGGIAFCD